MEILNEPKPLYRQQIQQKLDFAYAKIINYVANKEPLIVSVYGHGDYFSDQNKQTLSIDLILRIDAIFGGKDAYNIADRLTEQLKEYNNSDNQPYINIVLVDSKNQKLYLEDLYSIRHHGDNLKENIKFRKTQIKLNNLEYLLHNVKYKIYPELQCN